MPTRREHGERANSEARSREGSFDQLQKKTSRTNQQMELGLDTPTPPSRNDARHIVEQRHKSKETVAKPKPQVIRGKNESRQGQPTKPVPTKKKQDPPPHGRSTGTSSTKTASTRQKQKRKSAASRKRKKSKKKHVMHVHIPLPVFIALVIAFALLAGSMIAWQINSHRTTERVGGGFEEPMSRSITIESGMTARQIARLLADSGVLDNAGAFERYLELSGDARRLQAGSYLFTSGMTHAEIAEALVAVPVEVPRPSVTIFAGYTLEEVDTLLAHTGVAKIGEFLQAADTIARERALPFVEGWFLSGTYAVASQGSAALSIALAMQDALNDAIRPYLGILADQDRTLADCIIIASMIQRETNRVAQMPIVSGIMRNRLELDMPLGIDASLRYGLGVWDRPLTEGEYASEHPYNTRRRPGLPPTGIGAPSVAALDAAVNPTEHGWYYYIHDRDGELHPAATYEEHKANIEKYLR